MNVQINKCAHLNLNRKVVNTKQETVMTPKPAYRTFNIYRDEHEILTTSGLLMFAVADKRFVYIVLVNTARKQPHIFSSDHLRNTQDADFSSLIQTFE